MGATVTNIGPNSERVDYTAGTTVAELQAAVETALLAHGWELYDAAAGANARCYRAVCVDGVRYKPMVIDFNTAGYMLCKVYENWNAGTHVGTNLCYNSDNTPRAQRVNLANGGQMFVMATARYAHFLSYQSSAWGESQSNSGSGCFELLPANPEDIPAAGYPCWCWLDCGLALSGNQQNFAVPRTREGLTGANAGNPYGSVYSVLFGASVGAGSNIPLQANPWSSKQWVSDVLPSSPARCLLFGKLFGFKFYQSNVGSMMDTVQVKVDTNGFHDPSGALANFWVQAYGSYRWMIPA